MSPCQPSPDRGRDYWLANDIRVPPRRTDERAEEEPRAVPPPGDQASLNHRPDSRLQSPGGQAIEHW
jgi:hypothetical protein